MNKVMNIFLILEMTIPNSLNFLAFLLYAFLISLFVVPYVILGATLSHCSKAKYGNKSTLAWIPIANIYLLGKLIAGPFLGWILIAVGLLSVVVPVLSIIYGFLLFVLFIFAIVDCLTGKGRETSKIQTENIVYNNQQQNISPVKQDNQNIVSNYQQVNQVMPQNVNTFQNIQNNPQGYQQQIQNAIPTYNQPVQRQVQNQVNESSIVNNVDSMNNNSNM